MTTEQKAKAYEEALERAREVYQGKYKPEVAAVIAEKFPIIFPKLKEKEILPVPKDLEEAAEWYATHEYDDYNDVRDDYIATNEIEAFKAGAEWQAKHAIEHPALNVDEILETLKDKLANLIMEVAKYGYMPYDCPEDEEAPDAVRTAEKFINDFRKTLNKN